MAEGPEESPPIDALTVELHRLGALGGERMRYIALTGSDECPASCEMPLSDEDFLRRLHCLRYPAGVAPKQVADALEALGAQAGELLPTLPAVEGGRSLQVDLVLGAAELWAFPFEACLRGGAPVFADEDHPVILTRRIRQGFAATKRAWPVRPHVLFLHAPQAPDLAAGLIAEHVAALEQALEPWSANGDPRRDRLLTVELALGTRDVANVLRKARDARSPFTHIHLLAHGKAQREPITDQLRWGLRLGDEDRAPTDPTELAEALQPEGGLPVVITVAVCDSANQAATAIPKRSFAQELHGRGIPVVLASQLPLTEVGSVAMTRTFYRRLLRGEDARWALHTARLALRGEHDAGHDWVSLVGYVQVPEGYADHLMEVGVKCEIELLRAARKMLDRVEKEHLEPSAAADRTLDRIENEVTERIASLKRRLANIPPERKDLRSECHGILASAHKRLAELFFRRGKRARQAGGERERVPYELQSRTSLEASLDSYRSAFRDDLQNHWLGVQQLALEAVLTGRVGEPRDWDITFRTVDLALARDAKEYWAYGTLAELWLLAGIAGRPREPGEAEKSLDQLKQRAQEAKDVHAVPSTRDQLSRYVDWWTKNRGFFGERGDLARDAAELLPHLND